MQAALVPVHPLLERWACYYRSPVEEVENHQKPNTGLEQGGSFLLGKADEPPSVLAAQLPDTRSDGLNPDLLG